MTLFYAFLIFILLILLSISVYYYFRLKHIMGIKTKDCEKKENSLKALESGLVPLLTKIGNYRSGEDDVGDFLKSKYDDLENKLKEEKKKLVTCKGKRALMEVGFKELSELSNIGPDWNWRPSVGISESVLPISCVCN